MNEYYVYEWFVKNTNQVFYVGKGKNKRYRACGHKTAGFKYMLSHYDCDVRIVKDNMTEAEAFAEEIRLIAFYRAQSDCILVNITDGGEGASGYKCSEETKNYLSQKMKTVWEDDAFRKRMLSIRKDPDGPYKSKAFREKISEIVSGENNPNYGNRWTLEMKESLANKRRDDPRYKSDNNPNAKSVICLETNEFFKCIKDAMDKYNIKTNGSISVCFDEPQRTAGGKHWIISDRPLSDSECFEKYLQVLSLEDRYNPIICCETNELFLSENEFVKYINPFSTYRNTRSCLRNGKLQADNKTYMYVKDYLQSHTIEMSY